MDPFCMNNTFDLSLMGSTKKFPDWTHFIIRISKVINIWDAILLSICRRYQWGFFHNPCVRGIDRCDFFWGPPKIMSFFSSSTNQNSGQTIQSIPLILLCNNVVLISHTLPSLHTLPPHSHQYTFHWFPFGQHPHCYDLNHWSLNSFAATPVTRLTRCTARPTRGLTTAIPSSVIDLSPQWISAHSPQWLWRYDARRRTGSKSNRCPSWPVKSLRPLSHPWKWHYWSMWDWKP